MNLKVKKIIFSSLILGVTLTSILVAKANAGTINDYGIKKYQHFIGDMYDAFAWTSTDENYSYAEVHLKSSLGWEGDRELVSKESTSSWAQTDQASYNAGQYIGSGIHKSTTQTKTSN